MGKERLKRYYERRDLRNANVGLTGRICEVVADAGSGGISARQVVAACKQRGAKSSAQSIRSILSRLRCEGKLAQFERWGLYRVKREI